MKRKTTVYIEADLLKTMRVAAARSGKHDYEIMEDALRAYLGVDLLDKVASRSMLGENEALDLAYEELHQDRS